MKSFKQFLFENYTTIVPNFMLLENRIEFLKKTYPTIESDHDTHAVHKDAPAIIQHFADNGDPTKKKLHTQWIIGQYRKKNIRQEDTPRINRVLTEFEKHKAKLENKDINKYNSLSEVEDAVAPHEGTASTRKEAAHMFDQKGTTKIYDDDDISVHRLDTKQGAINAGEGTDWCTANKDDKHNMYHAYMNKDTYPGPDIHTIIDKKNKRTDAKYRGQVRKYQFHTASNQFMDERDNPISKEDFESIKPAFHRFIDKHPESVGAEKL